MAAEKTSCTRKAITCEALAPRLGRREVLAGLAGALALAPSTLAAQTRGRISDYSNDDGVATALARSSIGADVSMRGYFAPGMRAGVLFDLFERAAAPCAMCGGFHDAGASIAVVAAKLPAGVNMLRAIDVSGTIAVDARGKAQLIARDIAVS